jgi:hypothetical protein
MLLRRGNASVLNVIADDTSSGRAIEAPYMAPTILLKLLESNCTREKSETSFYEHWKMSDHICTFG